VSLCFIFSIVCYTNFNGSDHVYIASMGKNWSTGPISEVQKGGIINCPTGTVSILNNNWEGTVEGCYCQETDRLDTQSCGSNKFKNNKGCQSISAVNPIPLEQWKSTNLCGKRGPNYLQMKTASSPRACGAGFKSCGVIDSLENYLCYKDTIPCPYNFISIKNKNFKVPADKNYITIPLGPNGSEGKAIFSNEFTNSKIINEFKIDDDLPCLAANRFNLNHKPYLLEKTYGFEKCEIAIGGEYLDKSFAKVDTTTYNQLYKDNRIMKVIKNLPQFQTKYNYSEMQTSLFHKNYIGMNKRCLENMIKNESDEEFIKSLLTAEDMFSHVWNCALIGMLFCIMGFPILITMVFMRLCLDMKSTMWVIMEIIITFIPCMVVGAIIVGKINGGNFDFTELAQPGCTDALTQGVLSGFSEKVRSAKNMAAAYLSFGIIGILAGIAVMLAELK